MWACLGAVLSSIQLALSTALCRAQSYWRLISGSFLLCPWTDVWLHSGEKGLTLSIPDLENSGIYFLSLQRKTINRVFGKFSLLSLYMIKLGPRRELWISSQSLVSS